MLSTKFGIEIEFTGITGKCASAKKPQVESEKFAMRTYLNLLVSLATNQQTAENRYGHQHKELLERLERNGAEVEVTTESGAITIKTDGSRVEIWESQINIELCYYGSRLNPVE